LILHADNDTMLHVFLRSAGGEKERTGAERERKRRGGQLASLPLAAAWRELRGNVNLCTMLPSGRSTSCRAQQAGSPRSPESAKTHKLKFVR
jgi:hypothetical protein